MKKVVKILIIIGIFIIIADVSYAKYATRINGVGKVKLKTPILILEKSNLLVGEISKSKSSYSTDFLLKNYFENTEKINEIDFEYSIKLIPSTQNFPVKYSLLNLDTNEEILLNENLETDKIFIGTEKTVHRYRLTANWIESITIAKVEETVDVNIKIKATQIEKENL